MADFRIGDYDYTIIDANNSYVRARVWDRNKVQYETLHSTVEYDGVVYILTSMEECFYYCTSFNQLIEIPNSVTNMGSCFFGCTNFNQLITIPNLVTNMSYCFLGCTNFNQLITIPNSVTNMSYCFLGCTSFNQPIEIPNSVTNISHCFDGCTSFNQSITISNSVTDMGSCFYSCTNFNQSITIPNSVEDMSYCFSYTSFNQPIEIPNSVTNISHCFSRCTNFNQLITIPNSVTNMSHCFFGCTSFNQPIEIPNSVEDMSYCFYRCTSFDKSITIPDSVTNMDNCFYYCASFNQSITIPNSVTNMRSCFSLCTSFNQSVTIPNSVTNMEYCFYNCASLNNYILCFNKPSSYDYIFSNTTKDINIIAIGDDNYSTWQTIKNNSSNNIKIPNNFEFEYGDYKYTGVDRGSQNYIHVEVIDTTKTEYGEILKTYINNRKVTDMSHCFWYCTSFDEPITIPDSVTNMSRCFQNCTSFNKSITIPNSVKSMDYCFYKCASFDKPITISNSVKNMDYCFSNCVSFNQSITIPNSVISMNYCFYECASFDKHIIIPNSVINMIACFYHCTSFNQSIIIPNLVAYMSYCFEGCTSLASNISVYNSNISNSTGIFDGTTNDIYIINGQHGQSSQDAVAQTWRAIAANYEKVHYEVDDHTRPALDFVCTRTDSAGTPLSTGIYIKLEKSAVTYDDYIPYGWTKTSISKKVYQDSIDLIHDITPNPDEDSFVIECDGQKHIFFYKVSYQINGEEISTIANSTITKVTALLDFLGKGNKGGYIDEPGLGMSIGAIATRDGLNIEFPTTIGKNLLPPAKEAYKITSDMEVDSNKTYYIYNINDDIYEVVSNPIDDNIGTYYEKGKAVDLEKNQLIIGKYNLEDNDKAFIIGNGSGDEEVNRSNALTVDWDGNVETSGYITIDSTKGIQYKGTKATNDMIRFLDNTADAYGNGVIVGNGGVAMLAAGESYNTLAGATQPYTAGSKVAVIAADSEIDLWTNLNSGLSSGKRVKINNQGRVIQPYITLTKTYESNTAVNETAFNRINVVKVGNFIIVNGNLALSGSLAPGASAGSVKIGTINEMGTIILAASQSVPIHNSTAIINIAIATNGDITLYNYGSSAITNNPWVRFNCCLVASD